MGCAAVEVDPPHRVARPGAIDEQVRLRIGPACRCELGVEVCHEEGEMMHALAAGGEELRVRGTVVKGLE